MREEILYTPDEVAKKLKLSKYTIYEMIKRGDLKAHHIGRSIRVSQYQLELYLMETGKTENVFEAEIISEGDAKFALSNGVKIAVSTELEGRVKVSIAPEDIILSAGTFVSSARNMHKGVVTDLDMGERSVQVLLDIGIPLVVLITRQSMQDMNIQKGYELYAVFKTMAVKVIKQ
ncbi:MAG: helix-turn-helix domain-containing protein [Dehalobacterium sp.]|jgi:molybdopterin-binding protein